MCVLRNFKVDSSRGCIVSLRVAIFTTKVHRCTSSRVKGIRLQYNSKEEQVKIPSGYANAFFHLLNNKSNDRT